MIAKLKNLIRFFVDTVLRVLGKKPIKDAQLTPEQKRVLPWIRDNGDKTHRLQYDLSEQSLVIDIGGYEGQWASDIFSMYCCQIHIFEPVPEYAQNIKRRFERNSHISVHKFGLASNDTITSIAVTGDSSSRYKNGGEMVSIQLMMASKFFEESNISSVDLMKINIEGGEYDLLEHLISTNLVKNIRNLQIQFHDFFPDAKERMRKIQDALQRTHRLTYQYEFVWENWVVKT